MALIPGSVPATGCLAPRDDQDTYATQDEQYNRGGYRSVADMTQRDVITPDRRKEGMLVNVTSEGMTYQLQGGIENIHWIEHSSSGFTKKEFLKILQRYTDLIRPPTVVFDECESVWDGDEPIINYNECEDPNISTEDLTDKVAELCGVVTALVDTEGVSGGDTTPTPGEIDGNEESCIEVDGGGAQYATT